jgi:hypothetical protein
MLGANGGSYNVGVGFQSLFYNAANNNTAVGFCSLRSNTTGIGNTAVGHTSLVCNTTGTCNTAIGIASLRNNTIGCRNTGLGRLALYGNTTGAQNTAVGNEALICNLTGINNTSVGYSALRLNTASSNLGLGTNAGCAITTGACNVVIGSNTGTDIATSNCNIILSDGAGNIRMFVTGSTGNVGIKTITPAYELDVNGTGRFVALIETSTEKLKENIEPYTTEISNFLKLNPVRFTWKDTGKEDVGLLAEDVYDIFPEFVSKDEAGEVTGINYSKLATIFINVLKQHQLKIQLLEEEIKKLKQ